MLIFKNTLSWLLDRKQISIFIIFFIISATIFVQNDIPKKILPDISSRSIVISSIYPGAATGTIEKKLCIPLENTVKGLDNIDNVTTSIKGKLCNIVVFLKDDALIDSSIQLIENNIRRLNNLPSQASRPIVSSPEIKISAFRLVISGDTSIEYLSNISQEVIFELNALGITQISQENSLTPETIIEVSTENLNKYKITLSEIALSIEKNLEDFTSGKIQNSNQTIAIETRGTVTQISDLENTPLRSYPNGGTLRLRDIATLKSEINLEDHKFFYDGKPAITLAAAQGDIKELSTVSKIISDYTQAKNKIIPSNIKIHTLIDTSEAFDNRMKILRNNGFYGLLLVFIMLSIFLNVHLAFWVAVGIPVAFSGGLLALYLSGGSLNMISTFAFLLILGIIVDDAIVVSESIYTSQQRHGHGRESIVKGVESVSKPVTYAVITTIIMFLPLWFIPGSEGKLFSSIPLIATAALTFSLLECFFLLPAHLNSSSISPQLEKKKVSLSKWRVESTIFFEKILILALKWRYSVITFFLMIFLLCVSLLAGGWIKAKFISTIETDEIYVRLEMPDGMPRSELKKYIKIIEDSSSQLKVDLLEKYDIKEIKPVLTLIDTFGPNSASVILSLPHGLKNISSEAIAKLWREKVGDLELASHLEFISTFNKPGPSINIQLKSENQNSLHDAVISLKTFLEQYPEVYGVESTIRKGSQEINIEAKNIASNYNISTQDIALLVNQAFHGININKNANYNSDITIRLPHEERNTVWHLEKLLIPTQSGQALTLGEIANLNFRASDTEITRDNFKRTLNVSGYVNEQKGSSENLFSSLKDLFLDKLPSNYQGVTWEKSGSLKIKESTQKAFISSTLIAMIAMYLLLSILYTSMAKPLIVLSAVPFGVVGALIGHWVFNLDLTIWSFSGIAAVSGIVINDNVVLISTISDEIKKEHANALNAIIAGTRKRFRPILLTSATTIVGVSPIIFEQSLEAQFLIPMAISIAFGELFATIVSLFLVPCIYMLYQDFNKTVTSKSQP